MWSRPHNRDAQTFWCIYWILRWSWLMRFCHVCSRWPSGHPCMHALILMKLIGNKLLFTEVNKSLVWSAYSDNSEPFVARCWFVFVSNCLWTKSIQLCHWLVFVASPSSNHHTNRQQSIVLHVKWTLPLSVDDVGHVVCSKPSRLSD